MAEGRTLFRIFPHNILYPGHLPRADRAGRQHAGRRPARHARSRRSSVRSGTFDEHARPRGPRPHRRAAARRRPRARGRGRQPDRRPRRDRLRRRRIGLGQVRHRPRRHGAAAEGTRSRPAADPARGRGPAGRRRVAAARAALHAHGDDLPGADDRAQSGHALRRPDRRGARDPHRPATRERAASGCSTSCARCTCRSPSG